MEIYTSAKTAKLLNVTTRTLERWRSSNKFVPNSRTIGGHSRYSQEQIEKVLGKKLEEKKSVEEVNIDELLS